MNNTKSIVNRHPHIMEQLTQGNTGVIAGIPWRELPHPGDMLQALRIGEERVSTALQNSNNGEASQLRDSLRQIGKLISQIETPKTTGKQAALETRESFTRDFDIPVVSKQTYKKTTGNRFFE